MLDPETQYVTLLVNKVFMGVTEDLEKELRVFARSLTQGQDRFPMMAEAQLGCPSDKERQGLL